MEQPGLEPAPIWDTSVPGRGLTCCTTALALLLDRLSFHPLSLLCQVSVSEHAPPFPLCSHCHLTADLNTFSEWGFLFFKFLTSPLGVEYGVHSFESPFCIANSQTRLSSLLFLSDWPCTVHWDVSFGCCSLKPNVVCPAVFLLMGTFPHLKTLPCLMDLTRPVIPPVWPACVSLWSSASTS